MSEQPRASIIIPSRGMEQGLRSLFDALAQELAGKNVELILADDGSEKPLDFLEAEYRGRLELKFARQKPIGPAAARNLGIKNAAASIIIFLDSDVKPVPGWFEAIITPLEKDPGLAGVEGKTVSSNFEELNPFAHFLDNLEGQKYLTCNIAYRREWLLRAGRFDQRFKHPWREDSDLAFSILELGGKIIFEPKALVDHPVRPVNTGRMFWFYPVRRGYDWLLLRKHPELFQQKLVHITDLSELTFLFSFVLAAIFFALGWTVPGFFVLLLHQAIYSHILLRHLHFGEREAHNLAVPWRVFARSYFFFWPATFLALASISWGWFRFLLVKPFSPKK